MSTHNTTIKNLCPHVINLYTDNGIVPFLPEPVPARVGVVRYPVNHPIPFPVCCIVSDEVTGLPTWSPDTYYIVSSIVAAAAPHRVDLLVPGAPIRDRDGNVTGCLDFTAPNKKPW